MNQWWKNNSGTPGTGYTGGTTGTENAAVNKADDKKTTTVPGDGTTTQAFGAGLNKAAGKPGDIIAALAQEKGSSTVIKQITDYTGSGGRLVFNPHGLRLNGSAAAHGGQRQSILLEIPPQFREMKLFSLSLDHQQNLNEKSSQWNGKKSSAPGGQQDQTPGMSTVEVHIPGKGWVDLGGKKFAEARAETETLHDLVLPKDATFDAIRVTSAAVDPVHVNSVSLNFLPREKPATFVEGIFKTGTSFGDPWGSHSPPYVTREKQHMEKGQTRYPGAVTLNNNGGWADTPATTTAALAKLGWHADHDSILIDLDATKALRTVEVAIGDTDPANKPGQTQNNDGSQGRKGYAVLDIEVERANGKRYSLLRNENVPPQGVLIGTTTPDFTPQAGDKLRISVGADAAGIMGVRVGYGS